MPNSFLNCVRNGRVIAFALFCLSSTQLVFQFPYIVMLPGERAKVFSATLCLLTLAVTIFVEGGKRLYESRVALYISLTLTLLVILSSFYSLVPRQSEERCYVILSAALGGYWCSRLLLTDQKFIRIFQWLANGLLVGVIVLALLGLYLTGKPHQFLDAHWHPVGSRLLLLSFAPLSLALGQNRRDQAVGVAILLITLLTIYIVGRYAFIQSVLVIPAIVSIMAVLVFRWRGLKLRILALILVVTVAAGVYFANYNPKNLNLGHISVAYRVESLFFSASVALRHPILGNGLWAPRDSLLEDYTFRYPFVSKEQFSEWVRNQRTSENLYLTFLADLGLPFVIIYFGAVLYLLLKLFRICRSSYTELAFHPAAIFLPLFAECIAFLVVDDLFEPQLSWFFHILLGLIPLGVVKSDKESSTRSCALD